MKNISKKIQKTPAKGSEVHRCGLCGKTGNLIETECCGQWICDDEDRYVPFSYARNSCSRNHRRYTLCGYHSSEGHKGDWKTCKTCRKDFEDDLEMYVSNGTNEYNFEMLENPPAFKPTHCIRCDKVIIKANGGYTQSGEGCVCFDCEESPLEKFKPKKKTRKAKRLADNKYRPPLDQLLKLENPTKVREWPDYLKMGFTREHIFELIRMATDESLFGKPMPEVFGTIHAWRILGLLKAKEAIKPLTEILRWVKDYDDEWILEEMPVVFCAIGPDCLPELVHYLCDTTHDEFARASANTAIAKIYAAYPEARGECAHILRTALETYEDNGSSLNAFIISNLARWRDTESLTLMQKAFASNHVDCMVNGDWEDTQIQMGLLEKRLTPKRNYFHEWLHPEGKSQKPRPRYQVVETGPVSEDEPESELLYEARKDDLRKRRKKVKKNR